MENIQAFVILKQNIEVLVISHRMLLSCHVRVSE